MAGSYYFCEDSLLPTERSRSFPQASTQLSVLLRPANVTLRLARCWLPALTQWPYAKPKPRHDRREAKARQREAENSFENIARKWWKWWSVGKSPRHADYVLRRLEADVLSVFGHNFIDAATAADIRELMLAIEGRGASDVAKRAHETTGQIFRYAIAHAMATRNAAADFKPSDILAESKSENFARVDAKELPAPLVKLESYDGDALTPTRPKCPCSCRSAP